MSGRPEPGPLAEEAARLVEAALIWARRAADGVDPGGERLATGTPECSICPICRTMHVLRHPSPEMAERLTGVVTELASVVASGLRAAFDGPAGHPHGGEDGYHPGAADDPDPAPYAEDRSHPEPGSPAAGDGLGPAPAGRGRLPGRGSGLEHIDIA